ncbi:hypothetical protein BGZ70_004653 [Mortierella alpina]|uniref:Glycosyltransferase family 17 protein n=1 Tax=Mortierella alpina TaxID=64518 RepID=A0A9P6LUA8_MORAP|nr:hypothetical protein BGZ70_004653 [Mortierella alpina]
MVAHTAISTSPWHSIIKIKTVMIVMFALAISTLAHLLIGIYPHSFSSSLNPPSGTPYFNQADIKRQGLLSTGKHCSGSIPDARVLDFIMVNDELDALWIRLNELYDVMDTFYIVETNMTFSGVPKPLHFATNRRRFEQFSHKIIHVIVPPIPPEDYKLYDEVWRVGMWLNEMWNRNKGLRIAVDSHRPREGDWIILSDLDELPRASFIKALAHPDRSTELGRQLDQDSPEWAGDLLRLGCKYYFYSYEYLLDHAWNGPVAFRFREPDSPVFLKKGPVAKRNTERLQWLMEEEWVGTGNRLRNERDGDGAYMPEQCHHCSWCFSNITQVLRKMDSWSHQEFNLEKYRDRSWILERAKTGTDPFERSYETYTYIPNNTDVPTYILQHQDTYSFMCKRYGQPNAGFIDVNPNDPLGPLL